MPTIRLAFFLDEPGLHHPVSDVIQAFQDGRATHIAGIMGNGNFLEIAPPKSHFVNEDHYGKRPRIILRHDATDEQAGCYDRLLLSLAGREYDRWRIAVIGLTKYCSTIGGLLVNKDSDKVICVDNALVAFDSLDDATMGVGYHALLRTVDDALWMCLYRGWTIERVVGADPFHMRVALMEEMDIRGIAEEIA